MIKSYDVEGLIEDGILELDGVIDSKSNDSGEHDMYFVNTEKCEGGIMADFETWIDGDPKNVERDRYKITVEYIPI